MYLFKVKPAKIISNKSSLNLILSYTLLAIHYNFGATKIKFIINIKILENTDIKRYTSFDLPPFRYIPGNRKQKTLNHLHTPLILEDSSTFSIHNWNKSQRYLYAIDLFNYGYYWEVHEVLEKIWLAIGKTTQTGFFIQGIIQLSIAIVKKIEANSIAVERMKAKAIPKIESQKGIYLGIEINSLISEFENFINSEVTKIPFIHLHFK